MKILPQHFIFHGAWIGIFIFCCEVKAYRYAPRKDRQTLPDLNTEPLEDASPPEPIPPRIVKLRSRIRAALPQRSVQQQPMPQQPPARPMQLIQPEPQRPPVLVEPGYPAGALQPEQRAPQFQPEQQAPQFQPEQQAPQVQPEQPPRPAQSWEPEDQPDSAEGQWGSWGAWSQCNSKCEKIRTRQCQGIPRPEGVVCHGPYKLKNDCDPDICRHLASLNVPQAAEEEGVAFHINGQLTYPASKEPAHALNILLRFKPMVPNAILLRRYSTKGCHSSPSKCKATVQLNLVKQKLQLNVVIHDQVLKVLGTKKLKLSGWHTVVLQIFHSKASMSINNRPPLTNTFKKSPPPVNLNQAMKIGFMGKRIVSMKDAVSKSLGQIAELVINYKTATLLSSVSKPGHPRPIREERVSHMKKEIDSIYPPFAGDHFTSFPIKKVSDGKPLTFRVAFAPRYDPKSSRASREIVWFLPGKETKSFVFIGTTARKFYICVKRNAQEPTVCSHGQQLKDGTATFEVTVLPATLVVRWHKDRKSGRLVEQSAVLSPNPQQRWEPSNIVYLGGLPNALWNVLKEEKKSKDIIGFTGYIYSLMINGRVLSLKRGTVYSRDGLINALGSTRADDYKEVENAAGAENITLKCDYSQNVKPADTVHVKWLSGNKVIIPGVVGKHVNVTIQDDLKQKVSYLRMKVLNSSKHNSEEARRDMEGFYACQLNRNEERFLLAAFGVVNATTGSDETTSSVLGMKIPDWMVTMAQRTGFSARVIMGLVIFLTIFMIIMALIIIVVYMYHHDPAFRTWVTDNFMATGGAEPQKPSDDTHPDSSHRVPDPRGEKRRHRSVIYHNPHQTQKHVGRSGSSFRDPAVPSPQHPTGRSGSSFREPGHHHSHQHINRSGGSYREPGHTQSHNRVGRSGSSFRSDAETQKYEDDGAYTGGNVSTNCGTDLDQSDVSEVCPTEMDGLISDDLRTYDDDDYSGTYSATLSGTYYSDDDDDELDDSIMDPEMSTELNITESNTTAGLLSQPSTRRPTRRRRMHKRRSRSRSRSRSGSQSRSRSRSRDRRYVKGRQGRYRSRSPSEQSYPTRVTEFTEAPDTSNRAPSKPTTGRPLTPALKSPSNVKPIQRATQANITRPPQTQKPVTNEAKPKQSPQNVATPAVKKPVTNANTAPPPPAASATKPAAPVAKQTTPTTRAPTTATAAPKPNPPATTATTAAPAPARPAAAVKQASPAINNQNKAPPAATTPTVAPKAAAPVKQAPAVVNNQPKAQCATTPVAKPAASQAPTQASPQPKTTHVTKLTHQIKPCTSPTRQPLKPQVPPATRQQPPHRTDAGATRLAPNVGPKDNYGYHSEEPRYYQSSWRDVPSGHGYDHPGTYYNEPTPVYGNASPYHMGYSSGYSTPPSGYGRQSHHQQPPTAYSPSQVYPMKGCSSESWLNTNYNAQPDNNSTLSLEPDRLTQLTDGGASVSYSDSYLGELSEASPSVHSLYQESSVSYEDSPQPNSISDWRQQYPQRAFAEELLARTSFLSAIEEESS